jgi:hypothetical protein
MAFLRVVHNLKAASDKEFLLLCPAFIPNAL